MATTETFNFFSKKSILFLLFFFCEIFSLLAQNPAADGFDLVNSDTKAIEIADKTMEAMGGRKAWDKTRYITWNFFGARKHIWDKWTGNVRIENLRDKSVSLININTNSGKIFRNNQYLVEPDSIAKYVKAAKGAWINDAYWLLMPFKLKDSGVTLKYLGEEKTANNEDAYLIGLSFKEVGNTPQNKYQVWVTKADNLVKQWAYYAKADSEKSNFTLPWINYTKHGKILISGDRGERKLTEIKVLKKVDKKTFSDAQFSPKL